MVMIAFRKWVTTGWCEKLPFDNTLLLLIRMVMMMCDVGDDDDIDDI